MCNWSLQRRREWEEGTGKIIEEIMAKKFSNLMKMIILQTQETEQFLSTKKVE